LIMDTIPTVQNTKYGSPAFRAGLFPGDRLLELGGQKVKSIDHLKKLIASSDELEIPITFQRGEHTYTTPLKLGNDRKIGASFTEGVSDVTEVWVKDEKTEGLKTRKNTGSTPTYVNPFPKHSIWVKVFLVVGFAFSLIFLVLLVDGRLESNTVLAALVSISCFYFSKHLQATIDTRWLLGETLKHLKSGESSKD